MKVLILLSLIFLQITSQSHPRSLKNNSFGHAKFSFSPSQEKIKLDFCKTCIDFSGQFINQLLNIILKIFTQIHDEKNVSFKWVVRSPCCSDAGVVGGCADVCGVLENKTGSQIAGIACNLLCDYVGIKEFISIIEKADLDPIYYCELLKACSVKDDGDATIIALNVTPTAVQQGSHFKISLTFKTVNGTGTGEIQMFIHTQDGVPLGQSNLIEPQQPGSYGAQWSANAEPDPNCDPTQGPCEMWLPGNYSVEVAVCNGECGSKHPHSQIYDTKTTPFTVV